MDRSLAVERLLRDVPPHDLPGALQTVDRRRGHSLTLMFPLVDRRRQLRIAAPVAWGLATMELVRDRFASGLDSATRSHVNASLLALRDSVQSKDLRGASSEAAKLQGVPARL